MLTSNSKRAKLCLFPHIPGKKCRRDNLPLREYFIILCVVCLPGCSVSTERGGAGFSAVLYQGPAARFGRRLPAGLPAGVRLQLRARHQQHSGGPLGPQPGQTGPSHAEVTLHTLGGPLHVMLQHALLKKRREIKISEHIIVTELCNALKQ